MLSTSGSSQQTEYAIKCRELERRLAERELEHQKELASMKAKMMKMSASELYQDSNWAATFSPNTISPLRPIKKYP